MQHMARAFAQTGVNVQLLTQMSLTERLFWSSSRLDAKPPSKSKTAIEPLDESENGRYKVRRLITSVRSSRDADGFFTGDHYPRFIEAATRYCLQTRPDLVFTRSRRLAVLLIKAGQPTLVECHNPLRDPQPPNTDMFELTLLKDNPNYLGMVTISDVLKESYLRGGYTEKQVLVWPDAVDLRPFDIAMSQRKTPKAQNAPFRVGYCGQLYPQKGIGVLLQAAQMLPHTVFDIVGGNPQDITNWKEQARGLSNTTFHGFVPHTRVPEILLDFDAVCLPNTSDCKDRDYMSPLKMYEYMGAERAIVASSLPAISRVLHHEKNALLFAPDSAEQLAQSLDRLSRDPDLRQRLSAQARADVQNKTWEARAKDILQWVKAA
jgi:glycosyltransferase involved in cell wall biosynthesis